MREKIGQVTLDDTYYPGKDLYTDGAIEDEMLKIAGEYPQEELNQVIAEKKSWPVLYHFSHIRENIVSWLPFTGEEKVLEIGSGCGAITGALCRSAKEVTCIELSRKRSEINALRHKECGNLTILMGNFQAIEKSLTEKYDYITLIGVFEYGESYIQSKTPYVDFLKIIAGHLKPNGKIVMAIENRFGLKYWAGCTEDHFGTLFEGLEGYPVTNGVKTFTKKELTGILKKAGNLKAKWYFPFPDYKLPMTIYSEERLPVKGELNRMETNFDRLRLQLFQESPVYDSLLDNDLFPQFSNSFLLLIGREEVRQETIYAKFSNERDRRFDIRTDICVDADKKRFVKKVPADSSAAEHIERLPKIASELEAPYAKEGLKMNACTMEDYGARLEYLEGVTLEEKLDGLLDQGKYRELEDLLFTYLEKIRRIHKGSLFQKTPEFVQVFGDAALEGGLQCGSISNIDLVAGNILIGNEKVSVIDYEWTFAFPIPAHFIMYRMIHYYLESDGKRRVLKERDFYGKAGITVQEQRIYGRMEAAFQRYMQGAHIPLLAMYEEVSPGKAEVLPYYEQLRLAMAEKNLQVFYDRGEDFQEKDSCLYPMSRQGISTELPIPKGVRRIRLDPGESAGGLRVRRLRFKGQERAGFTTNGFPLGEGRYYFGGGDPQLILERIPEDAEALSIELEILKEQEAREEFWQKFAQVSGEKDAQIRQLKKVIHDMENTRVWKMYRKVKK